MLRGRIVFRPNGDGYSFDAPTRFDKLFSRIVMKRPAFIEQGNRGAEHIGPEDTFDGDYGRLLEGAQGDFGLRGTSPTGFGHILRQDYTVEIEAA